MRKLLAILFISYFLIPQTLAASVPGEIVIKLKSRSSNNKTYSEIKKLLNARDIEIFKTDSRFALVKLNAKNNSVGNSIGLLKKNSLIEIAEPNFIYHSGVLKNTSANDPEFEKLWSLKNTGQSNSEGQPGAIGADINILPLWEEGLTGRSEIKVAVIDTGISLRHPDLISNIWSNPNEIPDNGIDDDFNGFVDDVHGWNFINNTPNSNDDNNHGSHCAGVIGASSNDGIGIVGVNWNVSIIPLKFLDQNGSGTLASAVQAIQYASSMGVQVMSNSWSGGGFSQALFDVITEAKNKGIVFVAAAGNNASNADATPRYPAGYSIDNIISVAATDHQDRLAEFSNFGRSSVHLAAPGVEIYSTAKDDTYQVMSGTSMATPHVAGIAALMLSNNPTLNYSQIKDILIRSSVPQQSLRSKAVSGGRVSAYNAIHGIFPVVNKPDESLWKDAAFSFESPHPYANNFTLEKEAVFPGAKFIRVVVDIYNTEANYDTLSIIDETGAELERISGSGTNYISDYVEGSKIKIKFVTDISSVQYGFKISKLQVVY